VSSCSSVLADLPEIVGPSLFPCMTTSVVPILMMSPFIVLLVAIDICPYRIGRPLRPNSPAILLDLCLVTGLRGTQSVLYWRCQPIKYRCLGCPRDTMASQMDMVAFPTFDSGHRVVVCMHIDMALVSMGVEVSMQTR
jgi:hypothetical protein